MPGIDEADSQFRVRIVDPGSFIEGSFRTKGLGHGVSIIIGKKKGSDSMVTQAYRFDKSVFKTREQVQNWLDKHDIKKAEAEPLRWKATIETVQTEKDGTTHIALKGMVLDKNLNKNKWRVAPGEYSNIAKILSGTPITVDHSAKVRDVIGKMDRVWEDGEEVKFEAGLVTKDQSIITPIINKFVDAVSFEANADDRMVKAPNGKYEKELYNVHDMRVSIVVDPAYPNARFDVVGFCAAVDKIYDDGQLDIHDVVEADASETTQEATQMVEEQKKPEEVQVPPKVEVKAEAEKPEYKAMLAEMENMKKELAELKKMGAPAATMPEVPETPEKPVSLMNLAIGEVMEKARIDGRVDMAYVRPEIQASMTDVRQYKAKRMGNQPLLQ